jgi:hypothetical protein
MTIEPGGDLRVGHSLSGLEDHPCPLNITPRRRDPTRAPLKLIALVTAQIDPIAAGPGHDH